MFGSIARSDVPQQGEPSAQRAGDPERLVLAQPALEPERQVDVLPHERVAREPQLLVADGAARRVVEEVLCAGEEVAGPAVDRDEVDARSGRHDLLHEDLVRPPDELAEEEPRLLETAVDEPDLQAV